MAVPIQVSGDVPQGNSCLLYFVLTDYDQTTRVSVDNITTATMTLVNHDTGEVINGREDVDVKSSIDSNGVFSHLLTAEDNQIQAQDERLTDETHVAVVTFTATGPTRLAAALPVRCSMNYSIASRLGLRRLSALPPRKLGWRVIPEKTKVFTSVCSPRSRKSGRMTPWPRSGV